MVAMTTKSLKSEREGKNEKEERLPVEWHKTKANTKANKKGSLFNHLLVLVTTVRTDAYRQLLLEKTINI